jgi:hypothetical protein
MVYYQTNHQHDGAVVKAAGRGGPRAGEAAVGL